MISSCQGEVTVKVPSVNPNRLPRMTETRRDLGEAFYALYPRELCCRLRWSEEAVPSGRWSVVADDVLIAVTRQPDPGATGNDSRYRRDATLNMIDA